MDQLLCDCGQIGTRATPPNTTRKSPTFAQEVRRDCGSITASRPSPPPPPNVPPPSPPEVEAGRLRLRSCLEIAPSKVSRIARQTRGGDLSPCSRAAPRCRVVRDITWPNPLWNLKDSRRMVRVGSAPKDVEMEQIPTGIAGDQVGPPRCECHIRAYSREASPVSCSQEHRGALALRARMYGRSALPWIRRRIPVSRPIFVRRWRRTRIG